MKSITIIDTLEDIVAHKIKSCIVLYSGGVDGSYFLDWAADRDIDVLALSIGLEDTSDHPQSAQTAQKLGIPYVFQDKTAEFLNDFVSLGIRSNAYYQGLFPICSSFSRPLMAKTAVELAHERGVEAIVHTSTYMQNSSARFGMSLMALDPEIKIVAPFLRTQLSREQKLQRLHEKGITFETDIYSIDKNLWGRVIENGTLENPENDLPASGVFVWTRDIDQAPDEPDVIDVEFKNGLPVALNGRPSDLIGIVKELNALGGKHGVGRFGGLEDVSFGVKNHEIRESPAAQIIISAHRDLESAVLAQSELSLKLLLDNQWTNLVVSGLWYSHVVGAINQFTAHMSTLINGKVRIKLYKGSMTILSREIAGGLYYAGFERAFASIMQDMSFPSVYTVMGLPLLRRKGLWSNEDA